MNAPTPLQRLVDEGLERARVAHGPGFTVKAFEAQHGIASGTLSKLKIGARHTVDPKNINRFAVAFGLSVVDVMTASAASAAAPLRVVPPRAAPVSPHAPSPSSLTAEEVAWVRRQMANERIRERVAAETRATIAALQKRHDGTFPTYEPAPSPAGF